MTKVSLIDITGGYDLSKVNQNFQTIEDELNNKVLYRNLDIADPNQLEEDIDVNGKFLYNLPNPVLDHHASPKKFVTDYVDANINPLVLAAQAAATSADADAASAAASAASASSSAAAALVSETNAATSAGLAANYAQLANISDYGFIVDAATLVTDYGSIV